MSVIKTNQNMVVAYEPQPHDLFVRVTWHGPHEDGRHLRAFDGPIEPIEQYEATLAWAVEMADAMAHVLYVVPMSGVEVMRTEQFQRGFAGVTDQQRGQLRQFMVTTLAEIMRDCDDPIVRSDAYQVLERMKVVKQ